MPTLNVNGRKVTVDDSFLRLPPDQQNATVDEIASSFGGAPSPAASTPPAPQPVQPSTPLFTGGDAYDAMGNFTGAAQPSEGVGKIADQVGGTIKREAGNAAQAADDIARIVANGATFGQADRLAAWGNGPQVGGLVTGESPLDAERRKTKEAEGRAGFAGTAADLIGSLGPTGIISKGVGAGAKVVENAPAIGRFLANPFTQAGAVGAGYGATNAAVNGREVGPEALIGGAAGVGGQALAKVLTGTVDKVAGVFNKKPAIPTVEDLGTKASAAYKAADDAGVIVRPEAIARLKDSVQQKLANFGYSPEIQPGVRGFLSELARNDGQNVTLTGIETMRKVAGHLSDSAVKSERSIGKMLKGEIDDFASALKPADILTGNAQAGVGALKEARSLWAQKSKADQIAEAMGKADLRAASTGSGGNIDNATRQNLRRVLEGSKGWTADERQALETVVRAAPGQNTLRLAGKLSPSGNGLMAALGVGATAMNPLMAIPALGGMGAKAAADHMTQSSAKKLADIILAGGSRAATQAAPNAVQRLAKSERDRISRMLMALGVGGSVPATNQ